MLISKSRAISTAVIAVAIVVVLLVAAAAAYYATRGSPTSSTFSSATTQFDRVVEPSDFIDHSIFDCEHDLRAVHFSHDRFHDNEFDSDEHNDLECKLFESDKCHIYHDKLFDTHDQFHDEHD